MANSTIASQAQSPRRILIVRLSALGDIVMASGLIPALKARFPEIAREWHPTKNRSLKPSAILATSRDIVWWRCARDATHEWRDSVRHRTRARTKCPHCPIARRMLS